MFRNTFCSARLPILSTVSLLPELALASVISITLDVLESALAKYVVPSFDTYIAPALDEYVVPAVDDCVAAVLDKVVTPALNSNVPTAVFDIIYLAVDAYVLPVLGEVIVSIISLIDDASNAYSKLTSSVLPPTTVIHHKPSPEAVEEFVPFSELSSTSEDTAVEFDTTADEKLEEESVVLRIRNIIAESESLSVAIVKIKSELSMAIEDSDGISDNSFEVSNTDDWWKSLEEEFAAIKCSISDSKVACLMTNDSEVDSHTSAIDTGLEEVFPSLDSSPGISASIWCQAFVSPSDIPVFVPRQFTGVHAPGITNRSEFVPMEPSSSKAVPIVTPPPRRSRGGRRNRKRRENRVAREAAEAETGSTISV